MSDGIEKNWAGGTFNFVDGDARPLTSTDTNDNNQSELTYTFTQADVGLKTFKGRYTGDGIQMAGESNEFTVQVTNADGTGGNNQQAPYVKQIVAGPGIYISPANGRGVVTISTKPFNNNPVTNSFSSVAWTRSIPVTFPTGADSDVGDNDNDTDDFWFEAKKSGYFIAVGVGGVAMISNDGSNWINISSGHSNYYNVDAVSLEDDVNSWYATIFLASDGSSNSIGDERGLGHVLLGGFPVASHVVGTDKDMPDMFYATGSGNFYYNTPHYPHDPGSPGVYFEFDWVSAGSVSSLNVKKLADNSNNDTTYDLVAVGTISGSGAIAHTLRTSGTASSSWSTVLTASGRDINDVATDGNGAWVAVGSRNTVWTSTDGTTWTSDSGIIGDAIWRGVAYGNNKFLAVGSTADGQQPVAMYSEDNGATWARANPNCRAALNSVAYSPDLNVFVAVGDNGTTVSVSG